MNASAVVTGSGKTLAFGIPIIHTILEWRSGSEPVDSTEAPAKVESLYLPAEDEPPESAEALTEEGQEAEDGDDEGIRDQNQCASDEGSSEDENHADERLGCVKVIENADFDFDTKEAEEKPAGGQSQPLLGLVLTPTRELAVQVKHHIDAVAKFTGKLA